MLSTDHMSQPYTPQASLMRIFAKRFCGLGWADGMGLLLIAIATVVMLQQTWLCWPDPVVDFGRELYTPWQITQGKVLYRDLAFFNGPFSQYANALVFTVLGVGLHKLMMANFLVLMAVILLVYRMVRDVASTLTATCSGLMIVTLFAFNQYVRVGNYNWLCPYSHELTHGVLLSLIALRLAGRWVAKPSPRLSLVLGLVVGLVFLTKAEVFVACIGAVGLSVILPLCMPDHNRRQWHKHTRLIGVGLLMPPLLAWMLLSLAMSPGPALYGVLGTWAYLFKTDYANLPYFRWTMGMTSPWGQFVAILRITGWYILILGVWLGFCLAWSRSLLWRITLCIFCGLLVFLMQSFLGVILGQPPVDWFMRPSRWLQLALPWPLFIILTVVGLLLLFVRHRRDVVVTTKMSPSLIYATFAMLLLIKMFFNVHFWHYGFALALPAAVVVLVLLLDVLPAWLKRYGVNRHLWRGGMLIVIISIAVVHLREANAYGSRKTNAVGHGSDIFYADQQGQTLELAADYLRAHALPQQSLIALPECEMLGYLLRVPNPTAYGKFIPPEMVLFGENRMRKALELHPPTWIVLVHRNTSEYGMPYFGKDYAQPIMDWINAHYRRDFKAGSTPFNSDDRFGIVVYKRKDVSVSVD